MEHAEELLGVLHVVRAEAAAAAGIRDHAVETSAGLERARDRGLHLRLLRHVAADPLHAAAVRGERSDALGRVLELRFAAAADGDGCTVGGEPRGAGASDAGAAAGDEHGEAFEASGGSSALHGAPRAGASADEAARIEGRSQRTLPFRSRGVACCGA